MKRPGAINMVSNGATLPVRIRDRSGVLVGEGVTGRDIDLQPGSYQVGTVLSDGCEVLAPSLVKVVSGKTVSTPSMSLDKVQAVPLFEDANSIAAPSVETVVARRWRGDWLALCENSDPIEQLREEVRRSEPFLLQAGLPLRIERDFGADDLLLVDHRGRLSVHVMPVDCCMFSCDGPDQASAILVEPKVTEDGNFQLDYSSPIDEATNSFLNYVNHALLAESRAISAEFVQRGHDVMRSEKASLLYAVLSGYVLLRANRLDDLDHWTQQLIDLAPDLPDAYALRTETLARMGNHASAVEALRGGLDKGCPTFRSGVSYTLERLRLYIEVHGGPNGFTLAEGDLLRFLSRKAQLERAAIRLDTKALFATFE